MSSATCSRTRSSSCSSWCRSTTSSGGTSRCRSTSARRPARSSGCTRAPKYVFGWTKLDERLVELRASDTSRLVELETSTCPRWCASHFVGTTLGVALGYRWVHVWLEVTGGNLFCAPNIFGQRREIGGLTVYPAAGLSIEIVGGRERGVRRLPGVGGSGRLGRHLFRSEEPLSRRHAQRLSPLSLRAADPPGLRLPPLAASACSALGSRRGGLAARACTASSPTASSSEFALGATHHAGPAPGEHPPPGRPRGLQGARARSRRSARPSCCKDLDSSNGTFVNGRRVRELRLARRRRDRARQLPADLPRRRRRVTSTRRRRASRWSPRPSRSRPSSRSSTRREEAEFRPAEQLKDVAALRQDYEKLRIAQRVPPPGRPRARPEEPARQDPQGRLPAARRGQRGASSSSTSRRRAHRRRRCSHRKEDAARSCSPTPCSSACSETRQAVLTADAILDSRFSSSREHRRPGHPLAPWRCRCWPRACCKGVLFSTPASGPTPSPRRTSRSSPASPPRRPSRSRTPSWRGRSRRRR